MFVCAYQSGLRRPGGERVTEKNWEGDWEIEWPDRNSKGQLWDRRRRTQHMWARISLLPGDQSFLAVSGHWPLAPALSPVNCPPAPSPLSPSSPPSVPPGPRHRVRFRVWIALILSLSLTRTSLTLWFKGRVCAERAKENEAFCRCLLACRHHILCLLFSVINCRIGCSCCSPTDWVTGKIGRQAICLHHIFLMITMEKGLNRLVLKVTNLLLVQSRTDSWAVVCQSVQF